jgi:GGDEF domain-containing protein
MKPAPSLVAPAVLLPAAAIIALAHKLPASLATAVDAAPLLVFGSGALLGLMTRRGRLVIGVVILALADCALVNVGGRSVFDAVALLLPVNLAVVVWLGEENPFAGRAPLLFAITLVQAAVVAWLQHPGLMPVAVSLDQPIVDMGLGGWTALPQLAVLSFAAALGLIVVRFVRHGQSLAAGAAWALVASFLALDGVASGGPAGVHFATAGLLLLVGATWEPRVVVATDRVTGLPTRVEFNRALRRLPRRYTVAWVEIDEFNSFRNTHGADAAQRMLRLVAKKLRRVSNGGGHAYYWESGMFMALFPRKSAERAARLLEAVRVTVEELTLDVSLSTPAARAANGASARPAKVVERTVSVTISAGVAEKEKAGVDPKEVIEAAEQALQRARQAGMNRVAR